MEEWTVRGIVAQIFGLLGMAINFASYQARERRRVILIQLFGSTFFAVNMLMLGAYSGFLLNAIGIARALVYARPAVMKRARGWNAAFIALYALSYAAVFIAFRKPPTAMNLILELLPTLAEEAGALGSAILGLAAATGEKDRTALAARFVRYGEASRPDAERHAYYQKQYQLYKDLREFEVRHVKD